jgi:hypothetical protein
MSQASLPSLFLLSSHCALSSYHVCAFAGSAKEITIEGVRFDVFSAMIHFLFSGDFEYVMSRQRNKREQGLHPQHTSTCIYRLILQPSSLFLQHVPCTSDIPGNEAAAATLGDFQSTFETTAKSMHESSQASPKPKSSPLHRFMVRHIECLPFKIDCLRSALFLGLLCGFRCLRLSSSV